MPSRGTERFIFHLLFATSPPVDSTFTMPYCTWKFCALLNIPSSPFDKMCIAGTCAENLGGSTSRLVTAKLLGLFISFLAVLIAGYIFQRKRGNFRSLRAPAGCLSLETSSRSRPNTTGANSRNGRKCTVRYSECNWGRRRSLSWGRTKLHGICWISGGRYTQIDRSLLFALSIFLAVRHLLLSCWSILSPPYPGSITGVDQHIQDSEPSSCAERYGTHTTGFKQQYFPRACPKSTNQS